MWPIVVFFVCLFFVGWKLFALWILFTLSSLPGILKFNILFLNILFVLIGIILYSGFNGLNNILFNIKGWPKKKKKKKQNPFFFNYFYKNKAK